MRKILKLWPLFLLITVYTASYFNVDWMLVPILMRYGGISNEKILFVVGSIGFLELLGGYKGWSGLRGLPERWMQDDIEFIKQLKGEQQTKDFISWLKVRFVREYSGYVNDDREYDKFKSKRWIFRKIDKISLWVWRAIKSGGILLIFCLGLIPIPGFRVAPDVLCGTLRWKMGFVALATANFIKTAAFVYGWDRIL